VDGLEELGEGDGAFEVGDEADDGADDGVDDGVEEREAAPLGEDLAADEDRSPAAPAVGADGSSRSEAAHAMPPMSTSRTAAVRAA
jgi:hypothetical protein